MNLHICPTCEYLSEEFDCEICVNYEKPISWKFPISECEGYTHRKTVKHNRSMGREDIPSCI